MTTQIVFTSTILKQSNLIDAVCEELDVTGNPSSAGAVTTHTVTVDSLSENEEIEAYSALDNVNS